AFSLCLTVRRHRAREHGLVQTTSGRPVSRTETSSPRPLAKPLAAIIEDDPSAADALELVLRDWGAEVLIAAEPQQLLDRLGPRIAELEYVIADYDLGDGAGGVEAAQRLIAKAPQARVLVLSGAFRSGAPAARAAGFSFMAKPARAGAIIE